MALPPRKPGHSGISRGIGSGVIRGPAARTSGINPGVQSPGHMSAPPGAPAGPHQNDHQVFVSNDAPEARNPAPAVRRPGAGQSGLRARTSGLRAGVSGPRAGVGTGDAKGARPKRIVARQSSGPSAAESIFSNIGLRIGVVVFIALFGAAVKYSKGTSEDWKYYEKAGDLFHSGIGFDTASSLKEKMNRLPHSNVSDPMLKEFHSLFIEMLTLVEKGSDTGPPNPRIQEIKKKLVLLAEKLDKKYGS